MGEKPTATPCNRISEQTTLVVPFLFREQVSGSSSMPRVRALSTAGVSSWPSRQLFKPSFRSAIRCSRSSETLIQLHAWLAPCIYFFVHTGACMAISSYGHVSASRCAVCSGPLTSTPLCPLGRRGHESRRNTTISVMAPSCNCRCSPKSPAAVHVQSHLITRPHSAYSPSALLA